MSFGACLNFQHRLGQITSAGLHRLDKDRLTWSWIILRQSWCFTNVGYAWPSELDVGDLCLTPMAAASVPIVAELGVCGAAAPAAPLLVAVG